MRISGHRSGLALAAWLLAALPGAAQTGMAPSPLLPGGNADPHIVPFGDRYYVYTTGYKCFSSPDLVTWTRHNNPFDLKTLKWGEDREWLDSIKPRTWEPIEAWAPAVVQRNNKYYLYFSANHYLGVAVANTPTGPFQDAVGRTLYNRWDGIDPMAFVDDDGEAYVFFGYGGQFGGMAVGILNPDMISWKQAPRIIAHNTHGLKNYLEGPYMFKRKGVYYLTYSNDNWQTPEYNLQYATAEHPLGPYTWKGRFLEKDANHVGPGHHSILKIPGRDQWYIVYHRYDNTQTVTGVTRTTHIDTLKFNEDGTLVPVKMTTRGVRGVNLADANTSAVKERAWPAGFAVAARGLEVRAQGVGELRIVDMRGKVVAEAFLHSGRPARLRVAAPGAYRAVWRTQDGTWARSLAVTGP